MGLDINKIGDVAIVLLPGDTLEASNLQDFKANMEPVLEANNKIVFDMSQIRFVDSTGCGAFLSFLKMLKNKGGGLKLCSITDPVQALFNLMSFDKLFGIFKTREDAVKAFEASDRQDSG